MLRAATADDAEIHGVMEALRTAVNAGDVRGILVCWAPDGVLMPPHHSSVHGHAAIAEYFRSVFATRRLSFTFTGSSVTLLGDVALERLTYTVVATSVTGGLAAEDVGKGLHVYARQPGRRWRITQDIWSPRPAFRNHAFLTDRTCSQSAAVQAQVQRAETDLR
jgi:uncharacterized protein (TIGR02246 family)